MYMYMYMHSCLELLVMCANLVIVVKKECTYNYT